MIFVSYSHADGRLALIEVQRQFGVLNGLSMKIWSDKEIKPGSNWEYEIQDAVSSSRVVILIITPGFLQSDFVLNVEVPEILKRNSNGGMLVLPIYWTACHYSIVPWLRDLQLVTAEGESIGSLNYEERAKILSKIVGDCAEQLARTISVDINGKLILVPKNPHKNYQPPDTRIMDHFDVIRAFMHESSLLQRNRRMGGPFVPLVSTGKDKILDLEGLNIVRFPTNIPEFQEFDVINLRNNQIETVPDLNRMLSKRFKDKMTTEHKDYRLKLASIQRQSHGRRKGISNFEKKSSAGQLPDRPHIGLYLSGNPFIDPILRAAADQDQPAATFDVLAYCRGDRKRLSEKFKIALTSPTVRSVRSAALADAEEQGGELGLGPNKFHDAPDPKLLQKLTDARQQLKILVDRMLIQSMPGNSPPILRNTLALYLDGVDDNRPIPAMLDMYSGVILASIDDADTQEMLGAPLIRAFFEFDNLHRLYMGIYNKYQERDKILESCEIDFNITPVREFSEKFQEAASLFRSEIGRSVLTKAPQEFAQAVSALLAASEHSASALRERELRRWAVGGYATLSLIQGFLDDPSRTIALTADLQDVRNLSKNLDEITKWFMNKIGLSKD